MLLEHRSGNTPVVIARQLGRREEEVRLFPLDNFPFNEVDMLTLVLIGNSSSRSKDGWLLTPRGYQTLLN